MYKREYMIGKYKIGFVGQKTLKLHMKVMIGRIDTLIDNKTYCEMAICSFLLDHVQ